MGELIQHTWITWLHYPDTYSALVLAAVLFFTSCWSQSIINMMTLRHSAAVSCAVTAATVTIAS